MAEAGQFERDLPRSPEAPGQARAALASSYAGQLDADEVNRARLLTSELVTNAVLHGNGRIVLRAHLDHDRLLVEVIDEGEGFEHELRVRDFEELGGRGLSIVDAEASRWGVHEGSSHVWFELERPGPRLGENAKPAP